MHKQIDLIVLQIHKGNKHGLKLHYSVFFCIPNLYCVFSYDLFTLFIHCNLMNFPRNSGDRIHELVNEEVTCLFI